MMFNITRITANPNPMRVAASTTIMEILNFVIYLSFAMAAAILSAAAFTDGG